MTFGYLFRSFLNKSQLALNCLETLDKKVEKNQGERNLKKIEVTFA